jgi:hypothetical protein
VLSKHFNETKLDPGGYTGDSPSCHQDLKPQATTKGRKQIADEVADDVSDFQSEGKMINKQKLEDWEVTMSIRIL